MAIINRRYPYLIALVFAAFFLSAHLTAQEEKLFCPFDGRNWKIGFQEYASDQSLIEMVLEEEDILNWKELFTVQTFDGINLSASDFSQNLEHAFKELVSEHQDLIFNRFEPKELNIFESSFVLKESDKLTSSDMVHDEYNLGRVLKDQTAIYYVRYSAKDSQTFEKNKQGWLERFKHMYLAKEPRPDQQGHWLAFTNDGVYENDKKLPYESSNRVFSNTQIGFSLSLPKEWLVEEQDTKETDLDQKYPYTISLVFSGPNSDVYGGIAFHEKTSKSLTNLKPLLRKRYAALYKAMDPEVKLVGKGKLQTVLGERGIYLSLTEKDEIGWVAFFENADKVFRIELWGPKQRSPFIKADFDKLIANFQMLNISYEPADEPEE